MRSQSHQARNPATSRLKARLESSVAAHSVRIASSARAAVSSLARAYRAQTHGWGTALTDGLVGEKRPCSVSQVRSSIGFQQQFTTFATVQGTVRVFDANLDSHQTTLGIRCRRDELDDTCGLLVDFRQLHGRCLSNAQ